jgi:predicted dehydrogenase
VAVPEATDRPLRAAVIGAGFVGPHHVDAIRRAGYGEVVALGGADAARTAAKAASLGVERSSADAAELIADASIDVIHICTPNATHVSLASAALRAGRHVVIEKPIAMDAAGAAELVAVARESGRHAMVAFTYRGYPMIRRARQLVGDGEVGSIRLVHGGYLQDWLAEPTDWNWRIDPAAGGASRAVADIGTHWFDTVEHVTGLRIEAVFADLATFMPIRQRPAGGRVEAFSSSDAETESVEVASEDAATILVRFAGGARGSVVISQVSPGHKNSFSFEVAGERRSVAWAQEEPERLSLRTRAEETVLTRGQDPGAGRGVPSLPAGHPEGWSDALRDLLRPFYAAIAAGEPPPGPGADAPYPTLEAGERALRFVDAVVRSSATERWVSVEPGAGPSGANPANSAR